MMLENREFEIVVMGATGFTGSLVARYLDRCYGGTGLRWAIAGRSLAKLQQVASLLESDVPCIVADSLDGESLDALARRTAVIVSTVGPFARYGQRLVQACVDAKTHYADITGEPTFVREMIDRHHETAAARGVRIVHCCGFDSIPSDLGVLCVQRAALETFGQRCPQVDGFVFSLRGKPSGGTIATTAAAFEAAEENPSLRRIALDGRSLNPPDYRGGPRIEWRVGVGFDEGVGWTGPFEMAVINEKVVRRSAALLAPDDAFSYTERSRTGHGRRGFTRAATRSLRFAVGLAALGTAPIRRRVLRRLPSAGEGPSEEEMAAGSFELRFRGRIDGREIWSTVGGDADPGYTETAKMLAESGLCLLRDETPDGLGGGVLTPASAMGYALVERLRLAELRFDVALS